MRAEDVYTIDKLKYSYAARSNRLENVDDDSYSLDGFRDADDKTENYQYDTNGNLISDEKKGLKIIYNHLNQPVDIDMGSKGEIIYIYNATGTKVGRLVRDKTVGTETMTWYQDGFQYINDELRFFPTSEGYVNVVKDKYNYVYNYTDHLGNIRMSFLKNPKEETLAIMEENNYYPFGLKHENYNSEKYKLVKSEDGVSIVLEPTERNIYQYKFQGRELQDELGLNWYTFKWRSYDPTLGRFISIDPIAENYPHNSAYAFAENRVVESIDLEGKESWFTQDGSLATKAGPYTNAARKQLNLYSPSEVQQIRAKPRSNPKGPTFSQDRMTVAERKQHDSTVKAQMAQKEAIKQTLDNHENLGSPYTAKTVMEGVAYGVADVVTGEIIGKVFQGIKALNEIGALTSFDDVANFISKNGNLPSNFITKAEAQAAGWSPKLGNLSEVAPGKSIGGDIFKNSEGLLPNAEGRIWREADINFSGWYRGNERLLYSNDGLIYKTTDHYKTFNQITK